MKLARWKLRTVSAIALGTSFVALALDSSVVTAQANDTILAQQNQVETSRPMNLPTSITRWFKPRSPKPASTQPDGSVSRRWPRSQRPNKTRAGGSLNESCTASDKVLSALVPATNPVVTRREQPQIWVYVPYRTEQIASAEFSVNIGIDEKERLYRNAVALPQTPGFVSLTLPETVQLEPETAYRWYFTLQCEGAAATVQLGVDSGVERIGEGGAVSGEVSGLSYDEVADAAEQMMLQPQDVAVRDRWRNLLQQLELEDLADEPVLGR